MKPTVPRFLKNNLFTQGKKHLLLFLLLGTLAGCTSDNETKPIAAAQLLNVAYGNDPEQVYDIYLPEGRSSATKVMFLVHGGGWTSGDKEDMNYLVQILQISFPQYAIVNVEYRLATQSSPALPKQTDDIAAAVAHVESHYALAKNYGFLGASAGGHLSMLYAYQLDTQHRVKVVCNVVGPTDFNDPAYQENPAVQEYLPYITGGNNTPEYFTQASPVTHVNGQSPATIQFMGNADPLVPVTQGQRLKAQLDSFNVVNELNIYDAGHGDFSVADSRDVYAKLGVFLQTHL